MIELLVLDMDDTLYLERDYSFSGFTAAGKYFDDPRDSELFAKTAVEIFKAGGRGSIFNQALKRLGYTDDPAVVSSMLKLFRDHLPVISLCIDADELLTSIGARLSTGLISDGYLPAQARKVEALGLEKRIEKIVLTESLGREYWKPHTKAFEELESHFQICGDKCIYVGDNPHKDFVGPKALGWKTVRIARDGALHKDTPDKVGGAADYRIRSLQELGPILFRAMEKV